jgi:allose kinase
MLIAVIDIGGTRVRLGLAGPDAPAATLEVSTDRLRVADPVAVLRGLVAELADKAGRQPGAIVVGVPGFMDQARRRVVNTPNIRELSGLALADALGEACGIPVCLEHDVALLTRGERRAGCAQGQALVLGIYFGTGVGGAFLRHGTPLDAGAFAMQVGHIPVAGEGRACACGGVDCVEPYASGRTLEAIARELGVAIDDIFTRADPALARLIDRFIDYQAIAVATPVTLLDPDLVVLGGGVLGMAGYPFQRLTAAIERRLSPVRPRGRPVLAAARLGWPAVLQGALDVIEEGRAR